MAEIKTTETRYPFTITIRRPRLSRDGSGEIFAVDLHAAVIHAHNLVERGEYGPEARLVAVVEARDDAGEWKFKPVTTVCRLSPWHDFGKEGDQAREKGSCPNCFGEKS